ncbi:MAG: S8 family serine peptidase, partial [Gemmatimonadetes bacterium]|nr:S8 family serine peptidase [Gemmatimonadota bacterium]
AEAISRLQASAAAEQPPILTVLQGSPLVRPLWIANAVSARVTRETLDELVAVDEVRYVYASPVNPGDFAAPIPFTGVPGIKAPFDAGSKPVAWNLEEIRAPEAWDMSTGEGVLIALLDIGLNTAHPDLVGALWVNPGEVAGNGMDDDNNGYVDDVHGYDLARASPNIVAGGPHGAYVSGILVGDGSDGTVLGVAPDAEILSLTIATDTDFALAMEYAVDAGADVVNMSFSIPNLANLRGFWRLVADHAAAAGLVLTSGAGNFAQNRPTPVQLRIPEGIPSVLGVGGVDRDGQPTSFSSRGPVEWSTVRFYEDHPLPQGLMKPDVAAFPGPGYPILDPPGGYIDPNTGVAGNSFSGPQAAGVAALILSMAPDLNAWEVKDIIESTATDVSPPGKDNDTGWGVIDAAAAVSAATGSP